MKQNSQEVLLREAGVIYTHDLPKKPAYWHRVSYTWKHKSGISGQRSIWIEDAALIYKLLDHWNRDSNWSCCTKVRA